MHSEINIEKDFKKWCKIKIKLEKFNDKHFPKVWDIRNCYFWKNLSWEQNWNEKNNFYRSVLVIKSFQNIWNIIVLPLTKSKKPNYISYFLKKETYKYLKLDSYILLDKVKVISNKRLEWWKPLWKVSEIELKKIVNKFNNLFTI